MKNNTKTLCGLLLSGLLLSLTACSTAIYKTVDKNTDDHIAKANEMISSLKKPASEQFVTVSDEPYVQGDLIDIQAQNALPQIFQRPFQYTTAATGVTFESLITKIQKITQAKVIVTEGAIAYILEREHAAMSEDDVGRKDKAAYEVADIQDVMIHCDYVGDIAGFLDYFAFKLGIFWKYDQSRNTLEFFRMETKTFHVDILTDKIKTTTKVGSNSSTGVNQSASLKTENEAEYDNPWAAVIKTIKSIIGQLGSVDENSTLNLITVKTTPLLMRQVSQYLEEINRTARKKVVIRLDVYDVDQKNTSGYGFDWHALYQGTKGKIDWKTGAALTGGYGTLTSTISSGPWNTSNLIIKALQTMGKTTHVTGTTMYTVSGRPVPIQVSTTTAYIKQVDVVVTPSGNGNSVKQSATPGEYNEGYEIKVLPIVVKGNEILVDLSVNLTNLVRMDESKIPVEGSTEPQIIKLPSIRNKSFMQSVPLKSGQTVILAGFEDKKDNAQTDSVGPQSTWMLGGSQAALNNSTITVIVVTPYLIR
ncbi:MULTISPECIES: hypothetical protein [Cysteiniphilum]|uniref:Type II/III secretion system secretin-like domain-containing protein n=1 Tax=Cysteiniphilum litorale TaxID=2056700 RepID=A0A8J2Z5D0_9GAMM|nr:MULTISPECIES: hypothetical protein [Cysteiniphilum]GGG01070.1 hypothetical protein GCM10010995_18130 [Cysteiniphilum litorale]